MTGNPLRYELALEAERIVNTLRQTVYQYAENIHASKGLWDCDCNSFVGYVLEAYAPEHYRVIPWDSRRPRPLAFEYCLFFESLTPGSGGGWHPIGFLQDARRGDILAWRFPDAKPGEDTGHVVLIGDTPTPDGFGNFAVRVYDSADVAHFDETRGNGAVESPSGVGTGFINFQVDAEGRPVAFQFGPAAEFVKAPIAIGRLEPM